MNFIARQSFLSYSCYRFSSISFKNITQINLNKHGSSSLIFCRQYKNVIIPATKKVELKEVNTNVVKDTILFKYDNPKYYRFLNFFGCAQYVFWTYCGVFFFTNLKDIPVNETTVDENSPWYMKINLGESKYRYISTTLAFALGFGLLAAIWLHTLRSVRFLVLHKGGKDVTFVTYTPFGQNRMMKVNLRHVCSEQTRENCKVFLPVKVENNYLYYIFDMKGEFRNPQLFDHTVGLRRSFAKKNLY